MRLGATSLPPVAKGSALGTQVREYSRPSFLGTAVFADGLREIEAAMDKFLWRFFQKATRRRHVG
ncbi:hypothetical protein DSLASN_36270 [Desulfoluna limicola]|uniref:Uncharacterized protein n=1 Tax=Desulfoluna limicola TaxID=2810562 RepID=A0ABN6F885_9BACT|nr:hypothetical protein DSLASN_36270 [Desulfoluna limicola]